MGEKKKKKIPTKGKTEDIGLRGPVHCPRLGPRKGGDEKGKREPKRNTKRSHRPQQKRGNLDSTRQRTCILLGEGHEAEIRECGKDVFRGAGNGTGDVKKDSQGKEMKQQGKKWTQNRPEGMEQAMKNREVMRSLWV